MITHKNLGHLGRFGNQMFTISGCIGIATKNNHNFCFPQWVNYDHKEKFGSTEDCDIYNHLVNPLPEYRNVPYEYVWIDWGYRPYTFPVNRCFDLEGHMQSPSYFKHCIELVRHYLTFKDEADQNEFTAIHYRAGDYTHGKETYHPRQDRTYYEKAIDAVKGPYMVFSDDIPEARKMLGNNMEYIEGQDYLTDFKLMKKCKSFIGANSSFSLMAAILGNHPEKQMVFPSLWFGEAAGGLSTKDIYPENCIVI